MIIRYVLLALFWGFFLHGCSKKRVVDDSSSTPDRVKVVWPEDDELDDIPESGDDDTNKPQLLRSNSTSGGT